MDLVRNVFKKATPLLLALAGLSLFIDSQKLPAGILAGGILALLNIKALSWGVQGLLGAERAAAKMVFFSQLRLFLLFLILAALIYLKLVNVFGLLIGFTVVFALLMIEGYRLSRKKTEEELKS
jgi:hypothetical protein